ncbi:MAG: hypothetical protein V4773_20075 [Verrucomicrobiota bacterium]
MNLYSNVVLTVIAALLAVIAFRPAPQPVAVVSSPAVEASRTIDVNIVGVSKKLPVDFTELKAAPLDVNFAGGPLPVSVAGGPLAVTIAGVNKEIPVVVTGAPRQEKPLEVKLVSTSSDLPVVVKNVELPVFVRNQAASAPVLRGPIDVNIATVGGYRTGSKLEVSLDVPYDGLPVQVRNR